MTDIELQSGEFYQLLYLHSEYSDNNEDRGHIRGASDNGRGNGVSGGPSVRGASAPFQFLLDGEFDVLSDIQMTSSLQSINSLQSMCRASDSRDSQHQVSFVGFLCLFVIYLFSPMMSNMVMKYKMKQSA